MTRPLPDLSLLDRAALPVADLARIAMREGVRPRDMYQAHKWFARRFAVTARALLVGAACDGSASFWRTFYQGDAWVGRTVLDPFVGGGVMLLEAMRLGASVQGVDIEPVATAIARFQTTLRQLPDLREALRHLTETVGAELAPYYEARDVAGRAETLLHAFWVQTVQCVNCGHSFDAHPKFRLAWSDNDKRQWLACGDCSLILEAPLSAEHAICSCGRRTPTSGGRIVRGEAYCPRCQHREPLIAHGRRNAAPPRFRMFAVETLPNGDERRYDLRQRCLRSSTEFDHATYESAHQRLIDLLSRKPRALPHGPIPRSARRDNRLIDYGYSDYLQMFNARQQLHLALLGAAIAKIKGDTREGLAFAFSDHLTTNNMQCGYAGGWRRLTPLFSIRAFRHIARPVEINPWLAKNGRGTFPNAVRAVIRASNSLKDPREPSPRGYLKSVQDAKPATVDVVCGDAARMSHIANNSIDLVLTDPPYFDYISYSELGHFFTPWLRRFGVIGGRVGAGFPKGQLAASARSMDAERRFSRKLAHVFKELRRVCKPDGRVVFTYQNLDGKGWQALAVALARAGIHPIATLPLYGDSSAGLHKRDQSISWDAVMVCKFGEPCPRFKIDAAAQAVGHEGASLWATFLSRKGLEFTSGDRANIAHAITIVDAFAQTGRRSDGQQVA